MRAATDVPVAVGLGVSDGAQAAEVAAYADGVIVGSALVRCLLDAGTAVVSVTHDAEFSAVLGGAELRLGTTEAVAP